MRPMILLNPGPANTTDSVKQAMTKPDICPREKEFGDALRQVRDDVARVVDSTGEYTSVLFGGSGTAAVEAAVSSSVPTDGKLFVIDNGSYGARIADIARAYGIAHEVEQCGVGGEPDLARIESRLDAGGFSHLAVIHHETSTGMLNPVQDIAALCHARGVETIVDAMSSYAGIPIDASTFGADFLVSSSNKCIQGMAGLAFVICRRSRLDSMRTIAGRSFYLNVAQQHRFLEDTGQMQFTPPVQVVYALQQALAEYFEEGADARHARYLNNWRILDGGVLDLGFRRLMPEAILSRILTAYIEPDHPRYSFDTMHDRLYGKGFTIYPGKGASQDTFRLANMGAVAGDDMRAFLKALSETITEMEIDPLYSS